MNAAVTLIICIYAIALAVIFYGHRRGWFRPRLRPGLYILGRRLPVEALTITLDAPHEPLPRVVDLPREVRITGTFTADPRDLRRWIADTEPTGAAPV